MDFKCLSCETIYLRSLDLPSEEPRTVTGMCEPCGRERLGDRYDLAVETALETAAREEKRDRQQIEKIPGRPSNSLKCAPQLPK